MTTVKQCRSCKAWFPAAVGSWIPYCPTCFPQFKTYITTKIKASRQIPIYWFNLWDTRYPTKTGYEQVCRVCGKRLVNKHGEYLSSRRFCNDPCYTYDLMLKWDWNTVRHLKLDQNYRRADRGYHCEQCNAIQVKSRYVPNYPVHHVIPVHTLTFETLGLIWDLSNLKVLCPACHKKQDHQLKHSQKPGKRHQFKDITGYLEKGEFVR